MQLKRCKSYLITCVLTECTAFIAHLSLSSYNPTASTYTRVVLRIRRDGSTVVLESARLLGRTLFQTAPSLSGINCRVSSQHYDPSYKTLFANVTSLAPKQIYPTERCPPRKVNS